MTFEKLEALLYELGFTYNEMCDSGDWMLYENSEFKLYLHAEDESLYKLERK